MAPERGANPVLQCEGLKKAFGDLQAVDDVSFRIDAGETYGLLGPNGAGKTTTISMVAGLLKPDAGHVEIAGQRMSPNAVGAKSAVGLVPQDLAIYPDLSARENLTFFARLQGLSQPDLKKRVDEVLEVIALTDRADDRADEFSGGMKRRLNIGIGMLHDPQLLVLDEPTVGVDPQSRDAILGSVEALATEGLAVLYTTHYMEEAERLCNRIAIVDHGGIVAEGTRRQLVANLGEKDLVRLEVSGDGQDLTTAAEAAKAVDGVDSVEVEDTTVVCLTEGAAGRLPALLAAVTATGANLVGVEVREPDLEDVFLHMTGRALRD